MVAVMAFTCREQYLTNPRTVSMADLVDHCSNINNSINFHDARVYVNGQRVKGITEGILIMKSLGVIVMILSQDLC